MTIMCEKCDTEVPDEYVNGNPTDELWVECSCSDHPGWYCPNHSPGNDCYDDEECNCCNPIIDKCSVCNKQEDIRNPIMRECDKCSKDFCGGGDPCGNVDYDKDSDICSNCV